MGRNRRQQRLRDRRANPDSGQAADSGGSRGRSTPPPKVKPAWRQTLDSFGGFTVVGGIAFSIVAVIALIVINRPGSSANDEPFEPREHAQVNGRVMGDPNAPVKIIEYSDYQCPFCHRFWEQTEPTLVEEYVKTGLVSIEYRDYAFIGPDSTNAASGAACAGDQNLYWDFHDLLFHRQGDENAGVYSDSNMKRYAGQLAEVREEFDVDTWQQCYDAGTYEDAVGESTEAAASQGLTQTPAFIINGQVVTGAQPIEVFRDIIDAALPAEGASATPTATPAP